VGSSEQGTCVDPTPFWDGFNCVADLPDGEIRDVPDTDLHVRVTFNDRQIITLKEFMTPGT
jgi:hypothetical protein